MFEGSKIFSNVFLLSFIYINSWGSCRAEQLPFKLKREDKTNKITKGDLNYEKNI